MLKTARLDTKPPRARAPTRSRSSKVRAPLATRHSPLATRHSPCRAHSRCCCRAFDLGWLELQDHGTAVDRPRCALRDSSWPIQPRTLGHERRLQRHVVVHGFDRPLVHLFHAANQSVQRGAHLLAHVAGTGELGRFVHRNLWLVRLCADDHAALSSSAATQLQSPPASNRSHGECLHCSHGWNTHTNTTRYCGQQEQEEELNQVMGTICDRQIKES